MKGVIHYLPNGKPYKGATHKSGGRLMTGKTHTAQFCIFNTQKKVIIIIY